MDDRNPAPPVERPRLRRQPRPSPEQVRAAQDEIAAHLERIRDCETKIRSLQAEQAAAAAAFVDAQLALDEALHYPSGPDQHRAMVTRWRWPGGSPR